MHVFVLHYPLHHIMVDDTHFLSWRHWRPLKDMTVRRNVVRKGCLSVSRSKVFPKGAVLVVIGGFVCGTTGRHHVRYAEYKRAFFKTAFISDEQFWCLISEPVTHYLKCLDSSVFFVRPFLSLFQK